MSEFWDEEECDSSATPAASNYKTRTFYNARGNAGRAQNFDSERNYGNYQTSTRRGGYDSRAPRHENSDFRGREQRSDRREWNSNEESSEMLIDNSFVGRVIGRGGSKIQELQTESGAHIKVIKNDSGASDTTVRLVGSAEARDKAKTLIEELVSAFSSMSTSDNYRNPSSNSYRQASDSYRHQASDTYRNQSSDAYRNQSSDAYRNQSSDTYRNQSSDTYRNQSSDSYHNHSSDTYNQSSDNYRSQSSYNDYKSAEPLQLIDWDSLNKQCDEARAKKLAALPPIIKDFYKESPEVSAMPQREVEKFRSENNSISVMKVDSEDDKKVPNPVTSFKQAFQHYPELLEELRKQGFSTPSPIQCQAWPIILSGYDMIGIAQTGTGKTIAFLFPALIHLVGQVTPREQRVGPSVLVLAPTRELAQQIENEAKKYTYKGIKSICIYGGGNRRNQINNVSAGVDIVIATPGRLNDLVMSKVIDVTGVTYLVLDEADRMLDLGFEPQIRKIVIDIRSDRQTIMTSATWTSEIQELAARYMVKPLKVNVGAFDLAAVHTVTQEVIFGEDDYDERRRLLDEFIENMGPDDKAIVFVEKKSIADDISSDLILRGCNVQSIHGDREQYDREQALDDLKTGYVKILIATDVASRGIDIKDVTLIFNLYFPRNIEEYVHRVGRTGRAGRTGKAISVFTRKDWNHAEGLIKILEEANQYVPDELYEMADRYRAWKRKKVAEDMAAGGRNRRGRGRGRY